MGKGMRADLSTLAAAAADAAPASLWLLPAPRSLSLSHVRAPLALCSLAQPSQPACMCKPKRTSVCSK